MKVLVVPIAVLLTIVTACHRDRTSSKTRAGTTTLTGANWLANAGAAERIAASRCARETACGRVGPNLRFSDDQSCLREMVQRSGMELEVQPCPNGVDAQRVSRCEAALSHEPCASETEPLPDCRPDALCLRLEP